MSFDKFGTLTVQTFTAGGALPISNVNVHIYGVSEENSEISYSVITDRSGMTEKISLPAPSKKASLTPSSHEISYGLYNVDVSREDYYTKKFSNVAIFENVDTILPVNMVPKAINNKNVTYPHGNLDILIEENKYLE